MNIYRGDTKSWTVTFTRNDDPVDVTGLILQFTVKAKITDTAADAIIVKEFTEDTAPEDGIITCTLSSADTYIDPGSYYAFYTLVDDQGLRLTYKKDSLTIMPSGL